MPLWTTTALRSAEHGHAERTAPAGISRARTRGRAKGGALIDEKRGKIKTPDDVYKLFRTRGQRAQHSRRSCVVTANESNGRKYPRTRGARTKMTDAMTAPIFSCERAITIAVPAARSRSDRRLERCSRGPHRELARDACVLRSHAPQGCAVCSLSVSRACRPSSAAT